MKGRKPIPSYLKILRGNPGRAPIPKEDFSKTTMPEKPGFLSPAASEEWDRIRPELLALNAVRSCDQAIVTIYCMAVSQWRELIAIQQRLTPGDPEWKKVCSVRNQTEVTIKAYASELGLTQAARQRLGREAFGATGYDDLEKIVCGK